MTFVDMSFEQLQNLKQKISEAMTLLKMDELKQKMEQLSQQMNASDFWTDQKNATSVSQDYQDIKSEVDKWEDLSRRVDDLLELAESDDATIAAEIETQAEQLRKEFEKYELSLLLNGPYDQSNAIVAIHSGSGGTEAQDWVEMLFRMYARFCENKKWKAEILDESRGAEAGYKSVMFKVSGRNAFGNLKSEHGVHRLVRISPFDAEKMRHTSFALVEVLPELPDEVQINLDPKDLRIDTFMAGGHGGQSVNTTYSAVRLVHIPTGITVSCQNERSQLQNRETAMKILKAKLHRLELERMAKEKQDLRGEYKSAEWGNQIRSYVLHPYHMVKDLRSDYETSDDHGVLEGDLDKFVEAYLKWLKA